MNADFLEKLLLYGGLPALALGIIFILFRNIIGLEIFANLTRKQTFIIMILIIVIPVLATTVIVLSSDKSETVIKEEEAPVLNEIVFSGTITDKKSNEPIEGALVYILFDNKETDEQDSISCNRRTTKDGNYRLKVSSKESSFYAQLFVIRNDYDIESEEVQISNSYGNNYELTPINLQDPDPDPGHGQDPIPPKIEFDIVGISSTLENRLGQLIEQSNSNLRHSSSATTKIKFDNSSAIRRMQNGNYIYNSGYVTVKVNGNSCANFTSLTISRYERSTTDSTKVKRDLNSVISNLINSNLDNIANTISGCHF